MIVPKLPYSHLLLKDTDYFMVSFTTVNENPILYSLTKTLLSLALPSN